MADTYGMNVYDGSGNLKFSLVDNILRVIYVGECSSVPWSTGTFNVSLCTKSIDSNDLVVICMPVVGSAAPFTVGTVNVSTHSASGDNPAYTTASFSVDALGGTTFNGEHPYGTESTTFITIIGKA